METNLDITKLCNRELILTVFGAFVLSKLPCKMKLNPCWPFFFQLYNEINYRQLEQLKRLITILWAGVHSSKRKNLEKMIKLTYCQLRGSHKRKPDGFGKVKERFQVLPLLIFILVREGMCTLYSGSTVLEKAPASPPNPPPPPPW